MSDFPVLVDVKEAVFEAPKSAAASDLVSPGEPEGGFEKGVRDCGEEGLREEEGSGVWRVDGGELGGTSAGIWDALGILSVEVEALGDRDGIDEDGICVRVWF